MAGCTPGFMLLSLMYIVLCELLYFYVLPGCKTNFPLRTIKFMLKNMIKKRERNPFMTNTENIDVKKSQDIHFCSPFIVYSYMHTCLQMVFSVQYTALFCFIV